MRWLILILLLFVSTRIFDGVVEYTPTPPKFVRYATNANEKQEAKCLALNIYYEGRGEPYNGRLAIANATINRINYPAYPTTICGVVYQPGQFTWTTVEHGLKNPYSWYLANKLARKVIQNHLQDVKDNTEGAVSFHTLTVHPDSHNMVPTIVIGHHIFLRPVANKPS
jgi:spore germination cell wall hydrolase CwlJ-like protein